MQMTDITKCPREYFISAMVYGGVYCFLRREKSNKIRGAYTVNGPLQWVLLVPLGLQIGHEILRSKAMPNRYIELKAFQM